MHTDTLLNAYAHWHALECLCALTCSFTRDIHIDTSSRTHTRIDKLCRKQMHTDILPCNQLKHDFKSCAPYRRRFYSLMTTITPSWTSTSTGTQQRLALSIYRWIRKDCMIRSTWKLSCVQSIKKIKLRGYHLEIYQNRYGVTAID